MPFDPNPQLVYADGPALAPQEPYKPDIRKIWQQVEQAIDAYSSGAGSIAKQTLTQLNGDLAKVADTTAWVYADTDPSKNGIYRKSGASGSGSWARILPLPFSFIIASDVGAGTPNALQATTSVPVTSSALVWMTVATTTTDSPVTISFNGGAALTVKTNSGNGIAAGGLVAGMVVLGIVVGSTFRLVSDQVSNAVVAAAEAAAQLAIAAAATVNLPAVAPNRMLVDNPAGTARESKTFSQVRDLLDVDYIPHSVRSFGAVGDGVTNDDSAVQAAFGSGQIFDGGGKVYNVTTRPTDFRNVRNAAFKVGKILYPSRDWLRQETSIISNGGMYTVWPQDKAYNIRGQIRVWVMEKESHADATGRMTLLYSDDGGASWAREYLDVQSKGVTLWSAGFDGTNEYLFIRVPVPTVDNPGGDADRPPWTYQVWRRNPLSGSNFNLNGPFNTKLNVTFPTPTGFTGQPVMIHSFTVGHDGSIVVGASYGEGAAVFRSSDQGATWTPYVIATGNQYEEPTVAYIPSLDLYCGFIRNGGSSGNIRYWYSANRFATAPLFFSAPTGTFGPGNLRVTTTAFAVDSTGKIHANVAFRNGVDESLGTDDRASAFYIRFPAAPSSPWSSATTEIIHLGMLPRKEQDGASALGQGSVVIHNDKVHMFYGVEHRHGALGPLGQGNRVTNIQQTVVFLGDRGSFTDDRDRLTVNRAAQAPALTKIYGRDAYAIPFTDRPNRPPPIISGRLNGYTHTSPVVIASDVLNLSDQPRGSGYYVDTEGAAATDNLITITDATAFLGDILILRSWTSARVPTLVDNTGNLRLAGNFVMTTPSSFITLKLEDDGNWWEIARSTN